MPFQQSVNVTQAVAVAGDFATTDRRHSLPSVPGGYVAGANGLTVGLFAWADTATGTILANTGTGVPSCFIHRSLNATNFIYLSNATMLIPAGMAVGEMFNGGDFFVKNAGAGATTIGMKAFANTTNGTISFAATGSTVTGSVETKWYAMSINLAGELVIMSDTPIG